MRILALLFAGGDEELSIGAVAHGAGVAQATASREVARLAVHGLVVVRSVGRTRLVSANWSLPWAPALRSILTQTVGVLADLADALSGLDGIEAAFVYGSWAARYNGEPGPYPHDVDLLVVGHPDYAKLRAACALVERELRVEVNPIVIQPDTWEGSTDPFVVELRSRPLVDVPINEKAVR